MYPNDDARRAGGSAPECAADAAPQSPYSLRVIEGERKAAEFPARLHAQQADHDDLALIVAALNGATLRGFAAVITKALRGGAR